MEKQMIVPKGVFAHSRACVTSHYAVMPPEGILKSAIPGIEKTTIRVQASPAMGAKFAQVQLDMEPGGGMTRPRRDPVQHFMYVVRGEAVLEMDGKTTELRAGSFAFAPQGSPVRVWNAGTEVNSIIWIRKPYVAIEDAPPPPFLVGHRSEVEPTHLHTKGRTWLRLLPAETSLSFDFAVNILEFEPGNYFPMIETHEMEHGLYMLEGQAMYLLQNDWHECWAEDFIYMAPYCPQFCYVTGWEKAAYLLYKDINRDIINF